MSAVGSIMTNTGALQALNAIAQTSNITGNLQNQLASGLSINSPADNPAGYITAQGFISQLNGLTQATSNANQAVSLLQTAQGAIGQQIGIAQQLNSIAVQAANGTQTPAEAQSLQTLANQLTGQISTIAKQTQFNNINLLDGSFNGVQFQVGANEGQTTTLSIGNTTANNLGMYATSVKSTVYTSTGSAASGIISTAGVFTVGAVTITGPAGGSASFTATAKESAANAAAAANGISGTTGVSAEATTMGTFALTAGSANGLYGFTLQASSADGAAGTTIGGAVKVSANSLSEAISQINQQTQTSGIVASSAGGNLKLTQTNGQNIVFTAIGSGTVTQNGGAAVAANDILQGQVQFQSSAAFSLSGAGSVGTSGTSALQSLASINVSTTQGASNAINIIKYALAGLNNQGAQLGAVQQGLTANINNMNTSSQNITTALGVVQDANIPQVSTQLTQQEIKAQSGVAALKSSTQLQQAYLSLLP